MKCPKIIAVFILISFSAYAGIEALQCYVCENCIEGEELQEMHICGEVPETTVGVGIPTVGIPPSLATTSASALATDPTTAPQATSGTALQPSPVNIPTMATATSTAAVGDIVVPVQNTNNGGGGTGGSVGTSVDTPDEDTDYGDQEYQYEYEDDYHERRRSLRVKTHLRQSKQTLQPICYVVKMKVNNTLVTNRGCASLIRDNDNGNLLTCHAIYENAQIEDCYLCDTNGCNKVSLNDFSNGSGGRWMFFNGSLALACLIVISLVFSFSKY